MPAQSCSQSQDSTKCRQQDRQWVSQASRKRTPEQAADGSPALVDDQVGTQRPRPHPGGRSLLCGNVEAGYQHNPGNSTNCGDQAEQRQVTQVAERDHHQGQHDGGYYHLGSTTGILCWICGSTAESSTAPTPMQPSSSPYPAAPRRRSCLTITGSSAHSPLMKKIKQKVRISTVCISGEFCTKRAPVLMAPIRRSAGKTALWGAVCQRKSTTTTY